jgi:CTP-dependent riboflavin kinase
VTTPLPSDHSGSNTVFLESITGLVESGTGNANIWLGTFNAAYARKLGMAVFPGSLNLRLPHPFDWTNNRYAEHLIRFDRTEYGGERDILFLACRLASLKGHPAYLWTTTTPRAGDARYIIEIVTNVSLRVTYGLKDGDHLTVDLVQRVSGHPTPD